MQKRFKQLMVLAAFVPTPVALISSAEAADMSATPQPAEARRGVVPGCRAPAAGPAWSPPEAPADRRSDPAGMAQ